MRVAALYDVHGNLPALKAVLDDVRAAGVDQIVVGGDAVLGPMPTETLACLLALDIPVQFITGNCDREVVAQHAADETSPLPAPAREMMRWVAQQLPPEHVRELASWPKTLRIDVDGVGDVLFCHATPRNDNEIFTELTPEDVLLPVFEGTDASLVVCGHTHMQFDRTIGGQRVVNAGSVGMPFGEPGAYWLLLGPDVELRHTMYDLETAAESIRATSLPYANHFAMQSVLQPPPKQAMLKAYARAELSP
jgi:putative phosphoesterase